MRRKYILYVALISMTYILIACSGTTVQTNLTSEQMTPVEALAGNEEMAYHIILDFLEDSSYGNIDDITLLQAQLLDHQNNADVYDEGNGVLRLKISVENQIGYIMICIRENIYGGYIEYAPFVENNLDIDALNHALEYNREVAS